MPGSLALVWNHRRYHFAGVQNEDGRQDFLMLMMNEKALSSNPGLAETNFLSGRIC
jgi:hypothetical protein